MPGYISIGQAVTEYSVMTQVMSEWFLTSVATK